MVLRGIDIKTNEPVADDLSQYSIRFSESRVQIHSVVFSQNHVKKSEQPHEQTQTEFLDALVLGVVYSDKPDQETSMMKPISARMLRDKPTFKFDECTNADHVIIHNIKEKATSRQEYFQNNIKIQIGSHSQQKGTSQVLVCHGIYPDLQCAQFESSGSEIRLLEGDLFQKYEKSMLVQELHHL